MEETSCLDYYFAYLQSPTPMDSHGLQWAPMEELSCSDYSFVYLQSPTPMDSNGLQWKKPFAHIIVLRIYILQLQWAILESIGVHWS